MPAWPATLPCVFQLQDPTGNPVDNTIRPQPEVGEPLARRRFTGAMDRFTGRFIFDSRAHLASFLTFYRDDLDDGSLSFTGLAHPITGSAVECIFMAAPRWSRSGRVWSASVDLQTMP